MLVAERADQLLQVLALQGSTSAVCLSTVCTHDTRTAGAPASPSACKVPSRCQACLSSAAPPPSSITGDINMWHGQLSAAQRIRSTCLRMASRSMGLQHGGAAAPLIAVCGFYGNTRQQLAAAQPTAVCSFPWLHVSWAGNHRHHLPAAAPLVLRRLWGRGS